MTPSEQTLSYNSFVLPLLAILLLHSYPRTALASWSDIIEPAEEEDGSSTSSPMNSSQPRFETEQNMAPMFVNFDFSYVSDDDGGCFWTNLSMNVEVELRCFGRNITDVSRLQHSPHINESVSVL